MQGLRGVIGMRSSLYFGEVRHHRRSPKKHDLRYKLYMPHLFLDEVNEVFKDRWLWSVDRSNLSSFQRKDYHAPQKPSLEDAVRETISEQTGSAIHGPVSVLTHLGLSVTASIRDFLRFGTPRPNQCPPGRDHQHPVGRALRQSLPLG